MTRPLEIVTNNALVSTLVGTALVALVGWILSNYRNRRDSELIVQFLIASKDAAQFKFRSTEAIASHTRLPVARVEELCARHKRIRRNALEKESWTLVE